MDNDAEMLKRMGDHITDHQVKYRQLNQPIENKTMMSTRRLLPLPILLFFACFSDVRAQVLWTSASWHCVCSDCQSCDGDGGCCETPCTIVGDTDCVSSECTSQLAGCGLSDGFAGSKCFTSSRFAISDIPTSGCSQSACAPAVCVGATTVDIGGNMLEWGVPASSSTSSSVKAHGFNQSFTSTPVGLVDLAKLETINGTIFGTTGIGHATLRIGSEPVASPSGLCSRSFDVKDCDGTGSGQSVNLKSFFYNTPNLTGDKTKDADFLCFPQLNAGLLCDSPDPDLKALCPAECVENTALCPKCLRIPEDTDPNTPSGASIQGALVPAPPIPLPSQNLGTKYSPTNGTNNILIIPVLVANPFGEVQLAPFWQVAIDALPDACPNFLQLRNGSAGASSVDSVVEVAAFGTDDVDVHDIDPDRVRGIVPSTGEAVAPISIDFADIGAPAGSGLDCACGSSAPDGRLDLVLRFPASAWLDAWEATSQLGNQIAVSFRRLSDDAAAETADCVTLGVCPEADRVAPTVALTAPTGTQESPIVVKFTAGDVDGFDGDVVAERVLLDDCPVLDGDLAGNRDGILSAGEATIDTKALCRAARACHRNNFRRPLLTVQAVDCNGNTGSRTIQLSSKLHVDGHICKEVGDWNGHQDDKNEGKHGDHD